MKAKTLSTLVSSNYFKKTCHCAICTDIIGGEHVFVKIPRQVNGIHICPECFKKAVICKNPKNANFQRNTHNCKRKSHRVTVTVNYIDVPDALVCGAEVVKRHGFYAVVAWYDLSNNYVSHKISEYFAKTNYKVEVDDMAANSYDEYRIAVEHILGTRIR